MRLTSRGLRVPSFGLRKGGLLAPHAQVRIRSRDIHGRTHGVTVATYGRINDFDAARISNRAAQLVRQRAPLGPNRSRSFIRPTYRRGVIGVSIPPRAIHLYYLDRGIRPFTMWSLQGKTIPIRDADGTVRFRRATNVGQRVYVRDEKGRFVRTKIAWRHPGVPAMNFIEPAIRQAMQEWIDEQYMRLVTKTISREAFADLPKVEWYKRLPFRG